VSERENESAFELSEKRRNQRGKGGGGQFSGLCACAWQVAVAVVALQI